MSVTDAGVFCDLMGIFNDFVVGYNIKPSEIKNHTVFSVGRFPVVCNQQGIVGRVDGHIGFAGHTDAKENLAFDIIREFIDRQYGIAVGRKQIAQGIADG